MEFWVAIRLVMGNKTRNLFPAVGVMVAVSALVMTLSLGRGGREIIREDLQAIGQNRVLIGGEFSKRELEIVENIPVVEYVLFPKAREGLGENIFIGYPEKLLKKMGLKIPKRDEIILDREQNPGIEVGEFLSIDGKRYRVIDMYVEKSPLETMKSGRRVLMEQGEFERTFNRFDYREMVVAFPQGESSGEYIPMVIGQLKRYRGISQSSITLLETPEVYKKVERVMKLVTTVLYTLSFISLALGGAGVMNMLSNSVRENRGTIGIMGAQGVSKRSIGMIFLFQGGVVTGVGGVCGVITGILGGYAVGKIVGVPPVFIGYEILLGTLFSIGVALGMGVKVALNATKVTTVEALKI